MVGLVNAEPPENAGEYKNVLIFLETRQGKLAKPGLEMISVGAAIAHKVNEELIGIVMGNKIEGLVQEAGEYGCDKVIGLKSKDLEDFRTIPYSVNLSELITELKPNILLIPATRNGRDLASRIAVRSKTGVTADCTELDIDPAERILQARRPTYGESTLAEILCKRHRPQMATARPGIFSVPERDPKRKFVSEIRKTTIKKEFLKKEIVSFKPKSTLDLTSAKIIVSGGLGLGKPSGFKLLEELAGEIGASVGASRPTVDMGWIERDHQVGQTGQSVRPDIYIACGISGKAQHIMGMRLSKNIVSINTDASAELNSISDYIINEDLYKVIPELIDAIKRRKSGEKKPAEAPA
ncbi:MAG: electron transfer flavoprotein subunit alpha/FixB family protein [Candidatus Thermoplasmatota archaeon]|jgi:electron transfer flavoprotein alpha subunit|nr:electron transfer flavoprotein subunit alpha/FixB family protein [Candidatus Thermoplasmatota archaeon]MCL5988118.1 electron transfer flavoprotein subunit alpha/FixB family protein [Candidatus Thermoplasmatota archaeon]